MVARKGDDIEDTDCRAPSNTIETSSYNHIFEQIDSQAFALVSIRVDSISIP